MYKKVLDKVLINFTKKAKIKWYFTTNKNFLNEEIPDIEDLMHPVYITLEERNAPDDTRNKTKETIRSNIESYIKKVVCQQTTEYF